MFSASRRALSSRSYSGSSGGACSAPVAWAGSATATASASPIESSVRATSSYCCLTDAA